MPRANAIARSGIGHWEGGPHAIDARTDLLDRWVSLRSTWFKCQSASSLLNFAMKSPDHAEERKPVGKKLAILCFLIAGALSSMAADVDTSKLPPPSPKTIDFD